MSREEIMKRRFTALMTTLILSVIFSISASADVVEVDGIYYDISETTATVTYGDNEYSGDIVIPESITYNGSKYSVTSIGEMAFDGCRGLTSITIPNSVTSIGEWAFSDCSGLTSVTIPNSVTFIGDGAFWGCTGLTSITIPNSVTSIRSEAFSFCSGLTSVTIPNSVTSIGNWAFSGCGGLTSITIPNSVTSIRSGAFSRCNEIENVYCYAETVPSTKTDAFSNSYIEYATLHVPESAINAYITTEPWSGFGTFKTIEGTVGIESVEARSIAIQSADGFITISGLDSNEQVDFFATDGKALGSAKSMGGTATFAAQSGSVVVAKIGKESVKIAVE